VEVRRSWYILANYWAKIALDGGVGKEKESGVIISRIANLPKPLSPSQQWNQLQKTCEIDALGFTIHTRPE
jgi:hypothetical protein